MGCDKINQLDLKKKWEEMIETGEGKFIWIDTLLNVFLPLAILLIAVNHFFFTKNEINQEIVLVYVVKSLFIFLVGFLYGKFEWQFFQRLFGPNVNILIDIRKRYIINKGVLVFGLPLGIISFNIYNSSFMFEYVRLSIWLIIGVIYGGILWFRNKEAFEEMMND